MWIEISVSFLKQFFANFRGFHPLFDIFESVLSFSFFQVTVGEFLVFQIPSAFAKRQLSIVGSWSHLLASDRESVAPPTGVGASEQTASWVTSIDDGFSRFSLQITMGSVVNNFHVERFSILLAVESRSATESLRISSIGPSAVATGNSTCSFFITEWCQIIDMICRDVVTGLRIDSRNSNHQQ